MQNPPTGEFVGGHGGLSYFHDGDTTNSHHDGTSGTFGGGGGGAGNGFAQFSTGWSLEEVPEACEHRTEGRVGTIWLS